jgi:hypothetical protein
MYVSRRFGVHAHTPLVCGVCVRVLLHVEHVCTWSRVQSILLGLLGFLAPCTRCTWSRVQVAKIPCTWSRVHKLVGIFGLRSA